MATRTRTTRAHAEVDHTPADAPQAKRPRTEGSLSLTATQDQGLHKTPPSGSDLEQAKRPRTAPVNGTNAAHDSEEIRAPAIEGERTVDSSSPSDSSALQSNAVDAKDSEAEGATSPAEPQEPAIVAATPALQIPEHIVDPMAIDRFNAVLNFQDALNCRFSLRNIPADAMWGASPPKPWNDRFLTDRSKSKPIVGWALGTLKYKRLGANEQQHNVGILLFSDLDLTAARNLQYGRSEPPAYPKKLSPLTYFKRFPSSSPAGTMEFTEIYDGTETLLGWQNMQHLKLTVADVRPGDVVLVEFYVKRYKPRGEGNAPPPPQWETWTAYFELLRIAKMHSGPGTQQVVPDDSDVTI